MCPGGTLTVGVTSDEMLKSKSNANMVSRLPDRLKGVQEFLRYERPRISVKQVRLTVRDAADGVGVTRGASFEEWFWCGNSSMFRKFEVRSEGPR